ncbi:hypothetical protein [Paracoccus niistensis]|uniref:Uncharacterized protein n=1 Tax=Paracoccus niistensis TaxID=632935 RepID=A0ABV6HZW6_9RHOB
MNEDIWLVVGVAMVWALLALVYALAPWGDMIGYARVWGFGAMLFLGLAVLLRRSVRFARGTEVAANSDWRP